MRSWEHYRVFVRAVGIKAGVAFWNTRTPSGPPAKSTGYRREIVVSVSIGRNHLWAQHRQLPDRLRTSHLAFDYPRHSIPLFRRRTGTAADGPTEQHPGSARLPGLLRRRSGACRNFSPAASATTRTDFERSDRSLEARSNGVRNFAWVRLGKRCSVARRARIAPEPICQLLPTTSPDLRYAIRQPRGDSREVRAPHQPRPRWWSWKHQGETNSGWATRISM